VTLSDSDSIGAVVLDVEGTTTPVSFVYDVLFPFARARLRDFLSERGDEEVVRDALAMLAHEYAGDAEAKPQIPRFARDDKEGARDDTEGARDDTEVRPDDRVAYLEWLMDLDRKSTALKIIQGEIWRSGFESGTIRGEVYADVKPALERWRAAGRRIAIYSSGSVTAQRLLFGHSTAGDLTPLIDRHFDTTTGPKRAPDSYAAIARALELPPASILFLSDVDAELVAARDAGFDTRLCVRAGDAPPSESRVIHSFDEL
jgi:enolase-phosphatase E1